MRLVTPICIALQHLPPLASLSFDIVHGCGRETGAIFASYNRSHAGALGMDELRQCLVDLGMLARALTCHSLGNQPCDAYALHPPRKP